jgi:hypothetical protein
MSIARRPSSLFALFFSGAAKSLTNMCAAIRAAEKQKQ